MDISTLEVVTLGGKTLPLKAELQEVVRRLEEDGCLVLKGATDLISVESILSTDPTSLDFVQKGVVLNDAVKTILFSARGDDDFRITAYVAHKFSAEDKHVGRDKDWKKMAAQFGILGVSCTHLGGGPTLSWIIHIDTCSRGKPTGKTINMEATGNDIFICSHWLQRSTPRPQLPPPANAFSIIVTYMWNGFSERGKINASLGMKILELAGNQCSRNGEYILWLRKPASV